MKYMLLIHQGTTPTPGSEVFEADDLDAAIEVRPIAER
jgi:hypothetical protein